MKDFARECVMDGVAYLRQFSHDQLRQTVSVENDGREVKISADILMHEFLTGRLLSGQLQILSEEDPDSFVENGTEPFWILDPLDGSVNFMRECGPSAISLALWAGNAPVFGVVYRLDTDELFVGGLGLGSTMNGCQLATSVVVDAVDTVIAGGFPARNPKSMVEQFGDLYAECLPFSKMRMFGSAAVSLILLAQGAIDAYGENGIMLWDVAAGAAIVEGAGGRVSITNLDRWSCDLVADNGMVAFGSVKS